MEDEDEQGVSVGRALDQLLENLEWACFVELLEQSILRTNNLDSLLDLTNEERLSVVRLPRISSLAQIRTEKKFESRITRVASITNCSKIGVFAAE